MGVYKKEKFKTNHKQYKAIKMIKKLLFASILSFLFTFTSNAQRIAVVDITAVLESMSKYKEAQSELDNLAARWRREISEEYDKIKGMYNRYQAEQVLMSDDTRKQKEDEIMAKEAKVREMQKDKFGPDGALFEKRQQLVKPIQDRVYAEIEEFAAEKGFDFIFDKGGSAGIIFANEKYDKTADIKKLVGSN